MTRSVRLALALSLLAAFACDNDYSGEATTSEGETTDAARDSGAAPQDAAEDAPTAMDAAVSPDSATVEDTSPDPEDAAEDTSPGLEDTAEDTRELDADVAEDTRELDADADPDAEPLPVCCAEDDECGAEGQCVAETCWRRGRRCLSDAECEPDGACGDAGRCQAIVCGCASDADCGDPSLSCLTTDRFCGACVPSDALCSNREARCAESEAWWGLAFYPEDFGAPGVQEFMGEITGVTPMGFALTDAAGVETRFTLTAPTRGEGDTPYRFEPEEGASARVVLERRDTEAGMLAWWAALYYGDQLAFAAADGLMLPPEHLLGWRAAVEDVGCGFGQIGDCIQTRWALLSLRRDSGRRLLRSGEAATITAMSGEAVEVVAVSVYMDENACYPPELHGPRAAVMVLP